MGLSKGTTLRRRCQVENDDVGGVLVFRSSIFFWIRANASCDLLVIFAAQFGFVVQCPPD